MNQITPHTLQVIANFYGAAADAMAFTLMRTSHSAFVTETEDFLPNRHPRKTCLCQSAPVRGTVLFRHRPRPPAGEFFHL